MFFVAAADGGDPPKFTGNKGHNDHGDPHLNVWVQTGH